MRISNPTSKYQIAFFLLIPVLCFSTLSAQIPIQYHLNLDDINHHELNISIDFPSVPPGALQVRMPRASPGRYAVHNFAKNVYSVKAYDKAGKELSVYRVNTQQWEVVGHQGFVRFAYTLFGNYGDGTYTGIDNRKLHMNMPATFAYGVGMDKRPIELCVDLGEHPDWKVATQLKALDEDCFWAPDYYYFFDSPTMVGDIDFRRFKMASNGKEYTIEVAMSHEGTDEELDAYVEWVQKVVEAQKEVFGELPDYDFGRYTFLVSYNPWVFGDGMEHRNSTVCSSKGNLAKNAKGLIGTISHEFFHCWNVERLRPKSLEPFNFDDANMSGELWFAEGFTSYYDDLILCRAGIITPDEYARGLTGTLNYVVNSPGRQYRNPIEMSYNAPFVDDATANDETNFSNNFISYYSYGAVLGLCLDLGIRKDYPGKSLDDVMRYLWQAHGRTEVPYQIPDLQYAVAQVTGDEQFAADFFQQSIYGSELPDIPALLAHFGLSVKTNAPNQVAFRSNLAFSEEGAEVRGNVVHGGSLDEAGLVKGDIILSIDKKAVKTEAAFKAVMAQLKVGKSYPIEFIQNGIPAAGTFTGREDPSFQVMTAEEAGARISKELGERRSAWLKQ